MLSNESSKTYKNFSSQSNKLLKDKAFINDIRELNKENIDRLIKFFLEEKIDLINLLNVIASQGAGKTTSSILAIDEVLKNGYEKKFVFVLPNHTVIYDILNNEDLSDIFERHSTIHLRGWNRTCPFGDNFEEEYLHLLEKIPKKKLDGFWDNQELMRKLSKVPIPFKCKMCEKEGMNPLKSCPYQDQYQKLQEAKIIFTVPELLKVVCGKLNDKNENTSTIGNIIFDDTFLRFYQLPKIEDFVYSWDEFYNNSFHCVSFVTEFSRMRITKKQEWKKLLKQYAGFHFKHLKKFVEKRGFIDKKDIDFSRLVKPSDLAKFSLLRNLHGHFNQYGIPYLLEMFLQSLKFQTNLVLMSADIPKKLVFGIYDRFAREQQLNKNSLYNLFMDKKTKNDVLCYQEYRFARERNGAQSYTIRIHFGKRGTYPAKSLIKYGDLSMFKKATDIVLAEKVKNIDEQIYNDVISKKKSITVYRDGEMPLSNIIDTEKYEITDLTRGLEKGRNDCSQKSDCQIRYGNFPVNHQNLFYDFQRVFARRPTKMDVVTEKLDDKLREKIEGGTRGGDGMYHYEDELFESFRKYKENLSQNQGDERTRREYHSKINIIFGHVDTHLLPANVEYLEFSCDLEKESLTRYLDQFWLRDILRRNKGIITLSEAIKIIQREKQIKSNSIKKYINVILDNCDWFNVKYKKMPGVPQPQKVIYLRDDLNE